MISIVNFISYIIDITCLIMMIFLILKQPNNIFISIIFIFCIIVNHFTKYIMFKSLKRENKYEEI